MTRGTLTRTLGLAAGVMLAFTGSAQAAGTQGDTVTYDHPYALKDANRVVVKGTPAGARAASRGSAGADCRLPEASLYLAPHQQAIELRPVSLNRRTCRAVFEKGVPPKSARPSASGRRSAGGVQALSHQYRYGGYSRAWYQDRRNNNRVVNQVASGADWNVRNGCIGSNFPFFQNRAHSASGWFEVSHRWSKIDDVCRHIISSTNARFRDRNFTGCQGGPVVDAHYARVRFIGYPNGGIRGSRRSWIEPSCPNVLISYFALYRR